MRTKSVFRALMALVMCCFVAVSAWGQTTCTAEQSTFTAVSADNLGGDGNVSYTTAKGGGTSNPAANSGQIRLYQNSAGNPGGSITLKVADGYKIKSATVGTGMATTVAYSLDGATSPTATRKELAKDKTYTVDGLSASSVTFYCMGTDKNSRLYVNYLSVTYESVASLFVSIAPENGTEFIGSQQVTLTATDPKATIYYTTNGAAPTVGAEGTNIYNGPFEITESCIVKAIAVNGSTTSPVAISEFVKQAFSSSITSYIKVTSTDDLVDGGIYLIVNEESGRALGWQDKNNRSYADVIIKGGMIDDVECATEDSDSNDKLAREFILGISGGFYSFKDPIENGYLYAAGADKNNYLRIQEELDNNGKATLEFDTDGNTLITFQGTSTRNLLRYNSSNSIFSCYATVQKHIQLYRKVVQAKTAEAVGNFGTFYSESAYRMPQGLTGSVVYAVEGNSIKFTEVYKGGDEVPAYTALLISSGEVAGSFYVSVLSKDVEAKHVQADNLLEGGRADDGKTAMSVRSNVLYYKLAVNGSDYGFYWGAENGAPFTMKNSYTAYLAVPKSLGVKSFNINWNDVTGIEEVKTETKECVKEGIYTLTGRRVFTDVKKLPKGLYIVNGNKVMVK